jgi:subtilisin family serine protease
MKYKCSHGHEHFAEALPDRCPLCGSTLLRVLSGSSAAGPAPAPRSPPASLGAPGTAWSSSAVPKAVRRRSRWLWPVVVATGVVVLVAALVVLFNRKDSDRQIADVAKQYEDAVGVVVLAGQKDGRPFSLPIATAWAVSERVFVSNGHVAQPVAEALANGWAAFIILNKNPEKKFRVTAAIVHPKYDQNLLNVAGKSPAVPVYDVGLLRVDAPVPKCLKLAPEAELRKLDSGYRVAYLGFPTEGLFGGGVDPANPVANMQSGILTSTSDYWLSKAPFAQSLLLSHNLAATGGASGSPIFNTAGEVVGVLSAGNLIGQVDFRSGELARAPSAALINFAQRIDILGDIFPERPAAATKPAAAVSGNIPRTGEPSGSRILVKWKQSPGTAAVKTFTASTLARELRTFEKVGAGKLQVLTLPPGKTAASAVAQYRQNNLVEYAEPDYKLHLATLPNDPELVNGRQWALHNLGAPAAGSGTAAARQAAPPARSAWLPASAKTGTAVDSRILAQPSAVGSTSTARPHSGNDVDIGAEEGWQIRSNAADIIVAVIDSGVNYNHEDLAANMWRNPGEIPGNGIDDDHNGLVDDVFGCNAVARTGDPLDDHGHGTHVAGIIGAVGNNNIGVSGVAWQVKIMACKFMIPVTDATTGEIDANGDTSHAIYCIEYAISNGARIMNNSWGGTNESLGLKEAIMDAEAAGVIFVVAAGNEATNNDLTNSFPACCQVANLVSVGAIDRLGQPADFSNYGATNVHLFAPGVGILSTSFQSNTAYEPMNGTSMAAPVVSGALALVLANAPAGEDYTDAINRVLRHTRPLPSLAGKCRTGGMLNLPGALKAPAATKAGSR